MPPDELPPFAALLRRHRLAAGLSQEALAERAGLSARAIRALETGERAAPYHETVGMLATALGLGTADRAALERAIDRRRGLPVARLPDATSPGVLPAPLTSFIGRERELDQLRHRLATGRLVTLTGPPGVGKTRLAWHVVATLSPADVASVRTVELAGLASAALLPQTVATALGLPEQAC